MWTTKPCTILRMVIALEIHIFIHGPFSHYSQELD
jgi:hypothetical protein